MLQEPNGAAAAPLIATSGRPMKFTPERIQQIKNLVERGMSREQIAETIGVTLGSLQVTCSRMDISLRRPKQTNDVAPPQRCEKLKPENPASAIKIALQDDQEPKCAIEIRLPKDLLGQLALEGAVCQYQHERAHREIARRSHQGLTCTPTSKPKQGRTVGFCVASAGPNAEWHPIADFDRQWKAALYTSFLNGGQVPPPALLSEIKSETEAE